MTDILDSVTIDDLAEILQELGFRAAIAQDAASGRFLRSATGGVAFEVRPGNAQPTEPARYIDFFCNMLIRVGASLPAGFVNDWNLRKRFGRLYQRADVVVLEYDVVVAAGVTRAHVVAVFEVWNQLVNELLLALRTAVGSVTPPDDKG